MKTLSRRARVFLRPQEGPTATEYAILLGVICGAAFAGFAGWGESMDALYATLSGAVADVL